MALSKTDVIKEITKGTERDKQRRVGPSQLGNPCPKCLGRALVGEAREQEFSLYPWLGTGKHFYMEHHTFPDAQHELKLYVGDVEGYGPIKGTTDMYRDGTVVDWKFVGKKKIGEYRSRGVRKQYRYQAQLYARGAELAGMPVEDISIVFIPRDSGDVKDIFIHSEAYQPEMAQQVLDRAGAILARVQESGWQDLPSDPDCWECNYSYY